MKKNIVIGVVAAFTIATVIFGIATYRLSSNEHVSAQDAVPQETETRVIPKENEPDTSEVSHGVSSSRGYSQNMGESEISTEPFGIGDGFGQSQGQSYGASADPEPVLSSFYVEYDGELKLPYDESKVTVVLEYDDGTVVFQPYTDNTLGVTLSSVTEKENRISGTVTTVYEFRIQGHEGFVAGIPLK